MVDSILIGCGVENYCPVGRESDQQCDKNG